MKKKERIREMELALNQIMEITSSNPRDTSKWWERFHAANGITYVNRAQGYVNELCHMVLNK